MTKSRARARFFCGRGWGARLRVFFGILPPITLGRAPGSARTSAAWLEFPAGGPGPEPARDAIGPAMPAGAQGVTLYLARLSGASWPRRAGRVVGVSWGGRRWWRGEGVGCGHARGGERASGEGAVRVRALEPLNARLGFGRPTGGDSGFGFAGARASKRAIEVLDCKRSLFRRPAETGSHERNLTGDTLYVRSILKADHWDMLCCDADYPRKSRSGC